MKKTIISTVVSTLLLSSSINAVDIDIKKGWQLKGSSTPISLDTFKDAYCIDTVWIYDKNETWSVYSNSPTIQKFIKDNNLSSLNEIKSYDGFWIKAKGDCNITFGNISPSSIRVDAGKDKNIAVNETVSLSANVDLNLTYKWFDEDSNNLLLESSSKVLDTNKISKSKFDTSEVNKTKNIKLKVYDNSGVLLGEDNVKLNIIDTKFKFKGLYYGEVISPYTGRIWLDRNLGASQVCTDTNDTKCYGDYYQWGRGTDGHQENNSSLSSELINDITDDTNDKFITTLSGKDWLSYDNDGNIREISWKNIDGDTQVCPSGFRVPTIIEFKNETNSTTVSDLNKYLYDTLKLPYSGYRDGNYGDIKGIYKGSDTLKLWSSSSSKPSYTDYSMAIYITPTKIEYKREYRKDGIPIRCIKD